MKYEIKVTSGFLKELKHLSKKYNSITEDLRQLSREIIDNPSIGKDLGNGLRKVRLAISSKNKGKSGGARVITFSLIMSVDSTDIFLISIYDKSEKENITIKELHERMSKEGLI